MRVGNRRPRAPVTNALWVSAAEVRAETYYGRHKNGEIMTFNERPRRKVEQ